MQEEYGFVYIWYDKKMNRFYVGCHWGRVDDGYVCSSKWMRNAYKRRPSDFRRKILTTNITDRSELLEAEFKWLSMIKESELKTKYYNLSKHHFAHWSARPDAKSIAKKSGDSRRGKSPNNDPKMLIERGKKISAKMSGRTFSAEHKEKLRQAKLGKKQTERQKLKRSESLKFAWANGNRPRKKPSMTIEEQGKLSSNRLKGLWSDPIWAASQREKLRIGARQRYLNKSKQTKEAA
jgi:hypothetical protein